MSRERFHRLVSAVTAVSQRHHPSFWSSSLRELSKLLFALMGCWNFIVKIFLIYIWVRLKLASWRTEQRAWRAREMFLSVFHLLNKHHALPVFGKLRLMPWVVKYLDKVCKDTAQYAGNKTKHDVCVVFGNSRTSRMVESLILRHIVRATVCMPSIIELNLGSKPIFDYVWNVNNYHSSNTTL